MSCCCATPGEGVPPTGHHRQGCVCVTLEKVHPLPLHNIDNQLAKAACTGYPAQPAMGLG
jgi:hypothetical protein